MINPQFINEYSALTTQSKWQELRSVFAILNDAGQRLRLLELIVEKNQLNKEGVNVSDVAPPAPPAPTTPLKGYGAIE